MTDILLNVDNLHTEFRQHGSTIHAVNGLSYQLGRGESVAIVGESGSGKSVGVRSLLRLLPQTGHITQGKVEFDGKDLLTLSAEELRKIRGNDIGFIFQDAMKSLNPTMNLRKQLTEHVIWHGIASKKEADRIVIDAMKDVGLDRPETRLKQYPFQLSGGQRQRAMIAMALASSPRLLIADEPTTALDVTIQRQILDILKRKQQDGMSIILITHDLGVARYFCDNVVVMYAGKAVERGPMKDVLATPAHPYASGLLNSTLELGIERGQLQSIPGNPPNLSKLPDGCPFAPRCPLAEDRCFREPQELRQWDDQRDVACWKAPEQTVATLPDVASLRAD